MSAAPTSTAVEVLWIAALVGGGDPHRRSPLLFWYKGRQAAGPHVFRASRFSSGNLLFPTQVAVTPGSVVHYTPALVGGQEHSMHMAHVASVLIDRKLFFSNVLIESSGGTSPVRCHGHRKQDAIEMKQLIEQYQSDYYRAQRAAPLARCRRARPDASTSPGRRGQASGPDRRAEPSELEARFQRPGAIAAARRRCSASCAPAPTSRSTSRR